MRPFVVCPHWKYLLTLDSDLHKVSRFVEISEQNYKTYSIEFVRILLAAGSEIDVVAKLLCKLLDAGLICKNINDHRELITNRFPKFHSMSIDISDCGIKLKPWGRWSSSQNPVWRKAYNDVKHKRDSHFSDANLENTLNAVAGLMVITWYFMREEEKQMLNVGWGEDPVLLSPGRYYGRTEWRGTIRPFIPEEEEA